MNKNQMLAIAAGVVAVVGAGVWLWKKYRTAEVGAPELVVPEAVVEEPVVVIEAEVELTDPVVDQAVVDNQDVVIAPNNEVASESEPQIAEPEVVSATVSEGTQGAFGESNPYPTDVTPMSVEDYPALVFHNQVMSVQVLRMGSGTDYFVTPGPNNVGREAAPAFVTTELGIPGSKYMFADFKLFDRECVVRHVAMVRDELTIGCMQWPRGGRRDYYLMIGANEVLARYDQFENDADAVKAIRHHVETALGSKSQDIELTTYLLQNPDLGFGGEPLDDPDYYIASIRAVMARGNLNANVAMFNEGDVVSVWKTFEDLEPELTLILPRGRMLTCCPHKPGELKYWSNKSGDIGDLPYKKANSVRYFKGRVTDLWAAAQPKPE